MSRQNSYSHSWLFATEEAGPLPITNSSLIISKTQPANVYKVPARPASSHQPRWQDGSIRRSSFDLVADVAKDPEATEWLTPAGHELAARANPTTVGHPSFADNTDGRRAMKARSQEMKSCVHIEHLELDELSRQDLGCCLMDGPKPPPLARLPRT